MTTNVFDKKKNILATDSRWSFRIQDQRLRSTLAVAYVDDTGYDKIAYDVDTGYMFAGPGTVIDLWRTWALSPNQDILPRPPVADDFAVCMTDLETGDIVYEHGQKVQDTWCRMAGTGFKAAYECWSENGDAQRAVLSATKLDVWSGGGVRYLTGADRANNVDFSTSFEAIKDQFLMKGMVMYVASSQAPIPVGQAAKNDPRIDELVNKIKKGQLSAEAPSGLDSVIWTPADEQRLDEALAKRAERRRAR